MGRVVFWYFVSSALQLLCFVLMFTKGFNLHPSDWGWIILAWTGVFAGRFVAGIGDSVNSDD